MYKHTLKVHGEYLAKEQLIPSNTSVKGNSGSVKAGSTMGAMEVVMAAVGAVSIPVGTTLSLILEGSEDNVSFSPLPVSYVRIESAGGGNYAVNDELARLPVPSNSPKYIRCKMQTNKSSVTGKVDVFCDFLPR